MSEFTTDFSAAIPGQRLREERVFRMLCAVVQGAYANPTVHKINVASIYDVAQACVDEFERRTQEGGE